MNKQRGLTLIEIMISLLVGLIVIAATINIYIATIRGSTDVIRGARLNHDLDSALLLMINDIKRAGYWGGAIAADTLPANPFTQPGSDVRIYNTTGTRDCIVYSYDGGAGNTGGVDHDSNGTVDADEFYGFRLNNAGFIEMKLTGATTADCNDGTWQALTINDTSGEQLNITRLEFSFDPIVALALPTTSKCLNLALADAAGNPLNTLCPATAPAGWLAGHRAIETRQVNIVITGSLANDAAVTKTVTKTVSNSVKIRTDRILTY
ncbi:MAG: prepilin-type N-terminal cleavage/methylation domain-containing protein [Methylomicrobium sp.]|nr:prepilin-type N-terminal cleavage/methylation domain-containing protein [Methylomicrobium sp.]